MSEPTKLTCKACGAQTERVLKQPKRSGPKQILFICKCGAKTLRDGTLFYVKEHQEKQPPKDEPPKKEREENDKDKKDDNKTEGAKGFGFFKF